MEDILYFLFILGWLGISIYKGIQKQKSKSNPSPVATEEGKMGDLKTLFGDLFNEQDAPEIYSNPEPEFVEEQFLDTSSQNIHKDATFSTSDYSYNTVTDLYKLDSIEPEGSSAMKSEAPVPAQVEYIQDDHLLSEFDLRKAILYDAVLNPPYL
ncbi:MAG: hypothetical protein JEZ03_00330 [Bacteroidales bacterium]|nr:hypothetical protein [Bacteroidales bacterium]